MVVALGFNPELKLKVKRSHFEIIITIFVPKDIQTFR